MEKTNPKDRLIKALDDDDLGKVTGGTEGSAELCPLCRQPKDSQGICQNLACSNYGSYC